MDTKTRPIALGIDPQIEVNAKLFQQQIVDGYKDFRNLEDAYTISHFMLCEGNELHKANLNLYAALLGFLHQAKFWFQNDKFYSEKDLHITFNPQLN